MSGYYMDLHTGEELRAGDQWRARRPSATAWHTIPANSAEVGQPILPGFKIDYRRPVDLPVLQQVTPEAMAELEQSEWVGIIHTCEYYTAVKGWDGRQWYDEATGNNVDRPTGGWFIELAKLKEVQQ